MPETNEYPSPCWCAECRAKGADNPDSKGRVSFGQLIRNYQEAKKVLTGEEINNLVGWMKRTGRLE